MFMPRHALGVAFLSLFLAGCAQCPPVWASTLSDDETGWLAAGVAGTTFIDANAERLALTRAVRVLADRLGVDVEARLSVMRVNGDLFVEARGKEGEITDFSSLEVLDLRECDEHVHVLVRLPRP